MRPETTNGPEPFRSLHVLHLEDSPADCVLIENEIASAGLDAHVTRVATRQEFVTALARKQFDLILSDYTLPGYNGSAALKDAREVQPATPFIFVSGTIGEEKAIEIMKDGATDYVLKHRLQRLVPSIRRAVEESRERDRRQETEQALRESVQRLREMAENIQEVFWVRSADGFSIHYVSPACEQIWGHPPSVLFNKSTLWIEAVVSEDRARLHQALVELSEGKAYTLEYRITRPDGTKRWIEERAFPVRSFSGVVERTVAASVDITERKTLAEQLQQSQKMEAIGQLAGGIAHDFSNMLSVINGYSNLLLDHPGLPADVVESLKQIYVAGGRAASLTRQLLIFSRKAHPNSHVVDLNEIISDLMTMLNRLIGERITLQLDLASNLPATFADPGMIEQVVMNLVVNARDATTGGGVIVVSTGSCEVTAEECEGRSDARPGAYVWLTVRDMGSGIPPEILPRIFEPFFTTKEAGRGTGLGLSTVIGIARQHGGWVEVESEVGVGTLFRVLLPLAKEEEPEAKPATGSNPATVRGGKEVILLVEDEPSVLAYTRTVLEMYGYRVIPAVNGPAAVEAWRLHNDRISLLLTDLVMTDDMTGLDLAEILRAERPGLKVIFCSGYTNDASAAISASKGYSFLQKPYQPRALARMVRDVLDGSARTVSRAPFSS